MGDTSTQSSAQGAAVGCPSALTGDHILTRWNQNDRLEYMGRDPILSF